jgi:hypothetical protein
VSVSTKTQPNTARARDLPENVGPPEYDLSRRGLDAAIHVDDKVNAPVTRRDGLFRKCRGRKNLRTLSLGLEKAPGDHLSRRGLTIWAGIRITENGACRVPPGFSRSLQTDRRRPYWHGCLRQPY